ncbi:MAG: CehA/McbA family metallohydrolase [Actinobacteria bacterium]|nr:CehA/McbA family metallohydrolase [Actinomycetota bacterium]
MSPFDGDGIWLRCALHAHTTNSDGELAPDLLARHYEWAGYDVLAITDHWVRTVERSTRKLLVIPSVELNATCGGPEEDSHVLALGVEADPEIPDDGFAPIQDVVSWIVANGGVPYIAHTYWSGLRTEQWEATEGLVGIEVWNAGCELEIGRGDSSVHWDEALERGRLLYGIAADDSHHPGFDSGFAWTMVRAAEKSREAVLDALRSGSFYGSTGPEIHAVTVDDDTVMVRCSPAASVRLVSSRTRGAGANAGRLGYSVGSEVLERDSAGLITSVRLERPWGTPYGRVEVRDPAGGRAWTNPLWHPAS